MTSKTGKLLTKFRSVGIGVALLLAIWFTTAVASPAQTFTILHAFDGTNGTDGYQLVQGIDGDFYGTAIFGGVGNCGWGLGGCGTFFKITPSGTLTTLHRFCAQSGCPDGAAPFGVVQGTDGSFYGATQYGGSNACGGWGSGCGTVFKITPTGKLTTLYSFCKQAPCSDGQQPQSVIQAADGNFYGITLWGGGSGGYGTVFKMTPAGKLTTLHSFDSADGDTPFGPLVQGTDGNFYGTTVGGGRSGAGAVYKITSSGRLTSLHSFTSAEGGWPYDNLVQGTDGNLYGTTTGDFGINPGTVFKITPAGRLTTLYGFCSQANCTDGVNPQAGLVLANDGNFYGTTDYGGDPACYFGYESGCGTIFQITPDGTLTTLHIFESTDGYWPKATLLQHTNGNFYGTTENGGTGNGTVFSIATGLGPFVSFLRNPAKVGQAFGVLGQGFTGTTSVSFNGVPATFTVLRDTFLTAVVPAGATTVPVTVTTPSGVLTSNTAFRVTPQVLSFSPASGPAGTVVTIAGVSLTQTTVVGFGNYVPANFTVNSDTQVTATVPAGAKTGVVGVQTAGGTGVSSAVFTMTP